MEVGDLLLQSDLLKNVLIETDVVVQLGGTLVSKRVTDFLEAYRARGLSSGSQGEFVRIN